MKLIKKYIPDIVIIITIMVFIIFIFGFGSFIPSRLIKNEAAAELVVQNRRTTVMGDMRVVFADVELNPTADEYDTGLNYVFGFSIIAATGVTVLAPGSNAIIAVKNSNDGLIDSNNGTIWIDFEGSCCATAATITWGK